MLIIYTTMPVMATTTEGTSTRSGQRHMHVSSISGVFHMKQSNTLAPSSATPFSTSFLFFHFKIIIIIMSYKYHANCLGSITIVLGTLQGVPLRIPFSPCMCVGYPMCLDLLWLAICVATTLDRSSPLPLCSRPYVL